MGMRRLYCPVCRHSKDLDSVGESCRPESKSILSFRSEKIALIWQVSSQSTLMSEAGKLQALRTLGRSPD